MNIALKRLARAAAAFLQARGGDVRSGVIFLGLHKVRMDSDPLPLTLSPGILAEVLKEILRRHSIVSFDEFVDHAPKMLSGPLRFVLTFDDGYRDNYEQAWPVLKSLGVPATIFLSVDHIERRRVFWYERLADALMNARGAELDLQPWRLPKVDLRSPGARCAALLALNDRMKEMDDVRREEAVSSIAAKALGEDKSTGSPMLTWQMIREMHQGGISFGSHTMSHCILSNESRERVRFELSESKAHIERQLGSTIRLLAYPNGRARDMNEAVFEEARMAGYSAAVTTQSGVNQPGQDLFQLRRINLHNEAVRGMRVFSRSVFWRCLAQA